MQLNEILYDGQAETSAAFGVLMCQRSLSEGLQHLWNFILRNARAAVPYIQALAAIFGMRNAKYDAAAFGREFERVREQIEANLAHSAGIGPDLR